MKMCQMKVEFSSAYSVNIIFINQVCNLLCGNGPVDKSLPKVSMVLSSNPCGGNSFLKWVFRIERWI